MGVSGQLHAVTALHPRGKDPRHPLYWRLGEPQSWSGHMREEKSFRLCRGSNLDRPVVHSVVRHYTDWATLLPLLLKKRRKINFQPTLRLQTVYTHISLSHFNIRFVHWLSLMFILIVLTRQTNVCTRTSYVFPKYMNMRFKHCFISFLPIQLFTGVWLLTEQCRFRGHRLCIMHW
jgi:hypothetical protein